jgi:23S rRNA (guanosine2251-2'-O)-methyltransferase
VIVYGRNPVREAIRGPRAVSRIWATKNAAREPWLQRPGAPVVAATPDQIERRCESAEHQGVCAEVQAFAYVQTESVLGAQQPLIVALDQVQDPQNLGAICRSAECAGATAVVLPERRSAEVTPAVCKASAGAVEHLPICRVRNLADFLSEAKASGIWCYGADGDAPQSYEGVDFAGPVALVLGSEGRGLRPRVAAGCDLLISIPLRGQIESLSVGAAAAVLLYAAARVRPAT